MTQPKPCRCGDPASAHAADVMETQSGSMKAGDYQHATLMDTHCEKPGCLCPRFVEQDDRVKVLKAPADVWPLDEWDAQDLFEKAFLVLTDGEKVDQPAEVILPFKQFQAIAMTLDAERQNVGRLRSWVAHAGSNAKKPDAEARVLFLAASTALNRMIEGDFMSALEVLELAVNQAALSRAGKLELDLAFWAQVETRASAGVAGKDLVAPVGDQEALGLKPLKDGESFLPGSKPEGA